MEISWSTRGEGETSALRVLPQQKASMMMYSGFMRTFFMFFLVVIPVLIFHPFSLGERLVRFHRHVLGQTAQSRIVT